MTEDRAIRASLTRQSSQLPESAGLLAVLAYYWMLVIIPLAEGIIEHFT